MTCYLCGKPAVPFFSKNGFTLFRCGLCGLVRTELGRDYRTFVREHYTREYFTGDPKRSAYVDYKDDKKLIMRNMMKFLKNIQMYKKRGTLLDCGCAMGFFVDLALKHGFKAYGFDASAYATEEARRLVGKDLIQLGTIEEVDYSRNSFDVITMFDLFEHLADPRRDLRKIFSWLKNDGVLIIATGDTQSVLAKLLKRRWTFYIPPQHLFFFNKKNASELLQRAGFTPVQWFRIGKWLSFRYVLHLARTTGESELAERMYHLVKDTKVGKVPLYFPSRDNMVVVAQKKP